MEPFLVIKERRATRKSNGTEVKYKLSTKPEKPTAAAIAHFRSKFIYDAAFAVAGDGPYTWILKQRTENGARMLVAGKTRSQQELGTLHANLDAYSPTGTVIAAGEFVKAGSEVLFNLQSGSFMQAVFKKIKTLANKKAKREELIQLIGNYLVDMGLNPKFNTAPADAPEEQMLAGSPMIDTMEIVTNLNTIANYNRLLNSEPV